MNFNDTLGIHEQSIALSLKRGELLTTNLINQDTPGYQALDYDFKKIMSDLQNSDKTSLVATHQKHFSAQQNIMDPAIQYRVPVQTRLDGNTVDSQVEITKHAENAMHQLASLRFIDAKIKNMLIAIRGE